MKAGKINRTRQNDNFTTLPNQLLRDGNLSNKAKGLLCMILSLPSDWEIYKSQLTDFCSDKKDGIDTQFKELIKANYIYEVKVKYKGQYQPSIYQVFDYRNTSFDIQQLINDINDGLYGEGLKVVGQKSKNNKKQVIKKEGQSISKPKQLVKNSSNSIKKPQRKNRSGKTAAEKPQLQKTDIQKTDIQKEKNLNKKILKRMNFTYPGNWQKTLDPILNQYIQKLWGLDYNNQTHKINFILMQIDYLEKRINEKNQLNVLASEIRKINRWTTEKNYLKFALKSQA